MGNVPINIGLAANDHTGDPLRTAYDKINKSFLGCLRFIGDYDLSTDLLPEGVGSGIGGQVETGNIFLTTADSSEDLLAGGSPIPSGSILIAKISGPSTTDVTDWIILYTIH